MKQIREHTAYKAWFITVVVILGYLFLTVAMELAGEGKSKAHQIDAEAYAVGAKIQDRIHLELKRIGQITDLISHNAPVINVKQDIDEKLRPWIESLMLNDLHKLDIEISYIGFPNHVQNKDFFQPLNIANDEIFSAKYEQWVTEYQPGDDLRFQYASDKNTIDIYSMTLPKNKTSIPYRILTRFRTKINVAAYLNSTEKVFFINRDNIAQLVQKYVMEPVQLYINKPLSINNDLAFIKETMNYDVKTEINVDSFFEDGIEYHTINGDSSKLFYIVEGELLEPGWKMLMFFDASSIKSGVSEEVFEAVEKFAFTFIILIILTRLIWFHFKVRKMVYIDPLTQLYNRGHFNEYSDRLISLQDRGRIDHIGTIMIDIDHFKRVNDDFGHAIGDEVLKIIADIMRKNIRKSEKIYRFGGEEFIILCMGEKLSNMVKLAERIRLAVEEEQQTKDILPNGFTISLGVAERQPNENIDEVVNRSDEKLYQAKEGGRNQVRY